MFVEYVGKIHRKHAEGSGVELTQDKIKTTYSTNKLNT
jgi:hypothetical protein